MNTYALTSALWSLAGLFVGYLLGRAGHTHPEKPVPNNTPAPSSWWQRRRDQIIGVSLIVLAVCSVATTAIWVVNQQRALERQAAAVACQIAYNTALADAQEELRKAAATERDGQRKLLAASFAPDRTRASTQAAYRDYVSLLEQVDRRRNDHPVPAPPHC